MPALDVDNPGVSAVASFGSLFEELLSEAAVAKTISDIEPALSKSDFNDITTRVSALISKINDDHVANGAGADASEAKGRQYAIIETAARDLFSKLIATTPIDSPEFVNVWNLLDVLSILSDGGQCDPALLFWLAEELLDSQTIAGCRKIFDFLESRRDRITANHFKQKQLIILRTCNELLRRLSRAEDTAFCGRVFIFMFQSFPLGDKSSVNLRGEYHVENVTTYEVTPAEGDAKMDVDMEGRDSKYSTDTKPGSKQDPKKPLDPDDLYPLFWSLQESFSQPKRLFDNEQFTSFKTSLEATMKTFQAIRIDSGVRSSKTVEDPKKGLKRTHDDSEGDGSANTFNPKYLTSKDLFELEISDLSFRRHILVQALIIMDFLISLSAPAREKLASVPGANNKSVMYMDQILSEEDTKWANDMKKTIAEYLNTGSDGPYFFRMVETVLARDKNWVRWKIEGCHSIKRDPVSPASFVEAKTAAQRTAQNKRLRPIPMGAVPFDFLHEDQDGGLEKLRVKDRYELPELDTFKRKIADDDFEISMPTNEETKSNAIRDKASKSWRTLRLASRNKLAAFDKIDDYKNITIVYEDLVESEEDEEDAEPTASEDDLPANQDPIIISGPSGVGKTTVINKLMDLHKGVFASVVRHTTRELRQGEANGKTFHFVKQQEFNQLRDGDRFFENATRDGVDYGTSFKAVEAVVESGKVPIIELDLEAAQYAKDMEFEARYILVDTPSPEALTTRLRNSNVPEPTIQASLKSLENKPSEDTFSTILINDDLDKTAASLSDAVYEKVSKGEAARNGAVEEGEDAAMQDAPAEENGAKEVKLADEENKDDVQNTGEGAKASVESEQAS